MPSFSPTVTCVKKKLLKSKFTKTWGESASRDSILMYLLRVLILWSLWRSPAQVFPRSNQGKYWAKPYAELTISGFYLNLERSFKRSLMLIRSIINEFVAIARACEQGFKRQMNGWGQ